MTLICFSTCYPFGSMCKIARCKDLVVMFGMIWRFLQGDVSRKSLTISEWSSQFQSGNNFKWIRTCPSLNDILATLLSFRNLGSSCLSNEDLLFYSPFRLPGWARKKFLHLNFIAPRLCDGLQWKWIEFC